MLISPDSNDNNGEKEFKLFIYKLAIEKTNHMNFFSSYNYVRGLGFLALSLGVTTLYITPVRVYFIL